MKALFFFGTLLIGLLRWEFVVKAVEQKKIQEIQIKEFDPKLIRVEIKNLPNPYATESASQSPRVVDIPKDPILEVPKGFKVNVFAENLDEPRWLALTPSGDVLVTETRKNRILLLRDTNKDGVMDESEVFADEKNGLNIPFGMAFTDDAFYVGNSDAVLQWPFKKGQNRMEGKGEKIASLPGGGYRQHWTRNVRVSPDGKRLFVTIGSKSNADVEPLPRASVQVMDLDGSNQETFAYGLRNPVGLDFHPITHEVYVTVNERDELGNELVPDFFTRVKEGEFYGWPYAYLRPELLDPRHTRNGKSSQSDLVKETKTPDVLFEAHSAALGLAFYSGEAFPEKYRNGAFVAFRGSWNRSRGTGYKIVFVPFGKDNRPLGYYEDFVRGFLIDPSIPKTWGRPVGALVLPDGSLIFTEEPNGRIYRVRYES
ncbi:MAG: sorbosone dehydrogenase family protein [Verrucomicrobiae bacterium]|nr:sorbosone dehydrogenase family protein [Verrucomicrobiae bacterium]